MVPEPAVPLKASEMNDFQYYKRNLPHMLPPGARLFITMRLAGSLPLAALAQLRLETAGAELDALRSGYANEHSYARQKRYFGRFDALLDGTSAGPTWLGQPALATMVASSLHQFFDCGGDYELICYCLMPNHLHLVILLADTSSGLMRHLQKFKSVTALRANLYLNRSGQFWQRESYDHIIRDEPELQRVVAYVVNNPVKAGLAKDWRDWPHTYWKA